MVLLCLLVSTLFTMSMRMLESSDSVTWLSVPGAVGLVKVMAAR